MKIRFGYVSLSKNKDLPTPNRTTTYKSFQNIPEQKKVPKLKLITQKNVQALFDLITYNIKNEIHFYRITSSLIPLATHPDVLWDFSIFRQELSKIGALVKRHQMRVDMHPDHFNVLNSTRKKVIKDTIRNLEYHNNLLNYMGLENALLILHVGSKTGGKEDAIDRFCENFELLNKEIQNRIIIENDDKVFNVEDVLEISSKVKRPMVFDYHHHVCNPGEKGIPVEEILKTWEDVPFIPKFHLSSPKDEKNFRSHADFVDTKDFYGFLEVFRKYDMDLDIMIEAKMKDKAMFDLIDKIKKENPDWTFLDQTTLEL